VNNNNKSNPKADNYFSKALNGITECANAGHVFWKTNLGYIYKHGNGVTIDETKAKQLLLEPANQNYGRAQFMLGEIYDFSKTHQDKELAISWYEKAADNFPRYGSPEFALGYIYGEDNDYIDKAKSFEWYLKSANKGNIAAQGNLGHCYYYGYGVPINYIKAKEWFEKAASEGHGFSQDYLGKIYYLGKGVEVNQELALSYFLKATNSGFTESFGNIGGIYIGQKKYQNAFTWLKKGADKNQSFAQMKLGFLYSQEDYIGHDYEKAIYWYNLAIENGSVEAHARLGYAYQEGKGVSKNTDKAIEHYKISAEKDFVLGQLMLGIILMEENRYEQALEWVRKSAINNSKDGQLVFGILLKALGDKVNLSDVELAVSYMEILSKENYKNSKTQLQELRSMLKKM
ncbi:MAG TPA: sel1 repeat family protein, partial [Bacteroidetes bacterium]|nr:sel1 repeat family protein [Bacteroidota bacterium]